ncbi:MAG: hypothetical protein ACJAZZ_001009 [Dokdonia donghaensis]|jgi:hypothetical protein
MRNKTSLLNIPLFFILPFVSFLIAIRNLKSRTNGILFVAFCTLFGYAFTFTNTSADSYRVALVFNQYEFKSFGETYQLYLLGGSPDLYRFLCYTLTKSFTDNPKILFALFGLVFGIFWYWSYRLFLKEKGSHTDIVSSILVFIFLILNPITNINGARFNTATWIFVVATIQIVRYGNLRYFILLLCAPLVHFGYLFGILIVISFTLFKKVLISRTILFKLLFYVFVGSFLISWLLSTNVIKLDFLSSIIPSESISNKLAAYNSDDTALMVEKRASESLFLNISDFFIGCIKIVVFLIICHFRFLLIKHEFVERYIRRFFAFILFYFSLAFIASSVPSGVRFVMVGNIFAMFFFMLIYIKYYPVVNKKYFFLLIPAFSFMFAFNTIFLTVVLVSKNLWYNNVFWIIYEGFGYRFIYLD